MKKGIIVLVVFASFFFTQALIAEADQMWVNHYDYSYVPAEWPSNVYIKAEMTNVPTASGGTTEGLMVTISGMGKYFSAYLRLNLPTESYEEMGSGGAPVTTARWMGQIEGRTFVRNSRGEWQSWLPKDLLCAEDFAAYFPALMVYSATSPGKRTEKNLYPGSSYFKLGNGLTSNIVNHGIAMIIDCK